MPKNSLPLLAADYLLNRSPLDKERTSQMEALFDEYCVMRDSLDDGIPKLAFVSLYITARCHLSCIHCHAEDMFGNTPTDVPTEQLVSIINRLGIISDRIQLTGGEIMIRRDPALKKNDVDLLISEIHRRQLETIVQTTGMQVNETFVRFMVTHGVKWVSLSLDGPDISTNNLIRKNPQAFMKVISLIPILKKHDVKVKVGTVITRLNKDIGKLRELGEVLANLRVDTWKLMQFFPRESGRESFNNRDLLSIPQGEFEVIVASLLDEFEGRIARISSHSLEDFHNSPALLVQPTGLTTITQGNQDVLIGNILEFSPQTFINRCVEWGVLHNINKNAIKTY